MQKHIIKIFFIISLLIYGSYSLKSQTKVSRYYANKENNYGVVYTLPKSLIEVSMTVEESCYIPGELANYAELYLSVKAQSQQENNYKILSSQVRSVGVPDTTKRFLVAFNKKTVAPFVSLNEMGIIYSINGADSISIPPLDKTVYTDWSKVDKAMPSLPDTYSLAMSKSQQAFIAFGYYNKIKQSIIDIVTGDVEHMPKDGESMRIIMDRLNKEEARTRRLFLGDTIKRLHKVRVYIEPTQEDINEAVVMRFSPIYGVVSNDDISGDAVTLNLKIIDRQPEMPSDELKRFQKEIDGIVYNLPGRAEATLIYGKEKLFSGSVSLTQVGTMQTLRDEMFDNDNQPPVEVYFDINTGGIDRIKQNR